MALTNPDNARPTPLAILHVALDRAVWAAYGWDETDPAATDEDVILARLLALNGERVSDARIRAAVGRGTYRLA